MAVRSSGLLPALPPDQQGACAGACSWRRLRPLPGRDPDVGSVKELIARAEMANGVIPAGFPSGRPDLRPRRGGGFFRFLIRDGVFLTAGRGAYRPPLAAFLLREGAVRSCPRLTGSAVDGDSRTPGCRTSRFRRRCRRALPELTGARRE